MTKNRNMSGLQNSSIRFEESISINAISIFNNLAILSIFFMSNVYIGKNQI